MNSKSNQQMLKEDDDRNKEMPAHSLKGPIPAVTSPITPAESHFQR